MRKQVLHPHTAAINQKQKNQSKKAKIDALNWLAREFPLAFDNRVCIQPLSLGIMDEILKHADKAQDEGVSKSKLREAVVIFTRRIDYLTCLKAREVRVNLYGEATEVVTDEDAERAAIKIKKRVEKSLKNARRTGGSSEKLSHSVGSSSENVVTQATSLHSQERNPAYHIPSTPKTASVTVKHKQARSYDPDLVARLKEKLGISRRAEETSEETVGE